jgi:signal transduction histidine kinase
MLTLARADAGQEMLTREPVDLHEILTDLTIALQPLAQTRHVALNCEVLDPVVVSGDQSRLTQLLTNLIDNGLKYTPPGGSVTLCAREVKAWAIVEVRDTGAGIAPEHLPHLFERFYQADPSRSNEAGGTGLGLAICQWIVRGHGGDIAVESSVGHGTVVTVRLPLGHRP